MGADEANEYPPEIQALLDRFVADELPDRRVHRHARKNLITQPGRTNPRARGENFVLGNGSSKEVRKRMRRPK